jgi:hypothetical protein
VFLISDVHCYLAKIDIATQPSTRFVVADHKPDPTAQDTPVPQIALDQMHAIHHIFHGWDVCDPVLLIVAADAPVTIATAKNADTMVKGQNHTLRTCLKGPHRDQWVGAEFKQLDMHHSYGKYGKPLPRLAVPPNTMAVRPIWNYSQKCDGIFKACKCMNGNQLVCMGRQFDNTDVGCMEQHCLHMFVALSANLGFIIEDGDVASNYAHANTEGPTTFLIVDGIFQMRHFERHHIDLAVGSGVPLLKAIQGHP